MSKTLAKHQAVFDYGDMPAKDIKTCDAAAKRIQTKYAAMQKMASESVIAIGKELSAVQGKLANNKSGSFLSWLNFHFGWKQSTAYRFMDSYETFGEVISSHNGKVCIEPTAMYILSANNCPPEALDEAVELLKAGKKLTTAIAKGLHVKHKEPATYIPDVVWYRIEKRIKAMAVTEREMTIRQIKLLLEELENG